MKNSLKIHVSISCKIFSLIFPHKTRKCKFVLLISSTILVPLRFEIRITLQQIFSLLLLNDLNESSSTSTSTHSCFILNANYFNLAVDDYVELSSSLESCWKRGNLKSASHATSYVTSTSFCNNYWRRTWEECFFLVMRNFLRTWKFW